MINMTHRPNIHMRLRTLKLRLAHDGILSRVVVVSDLVVVKELVAAITRRELASRCQ
jgi:hypothetical protein